MFKRVDHVEIVPGNAEKTIDFYVNVLGFKMKNRKEMKIPPMREIIYIELAIRLLRYLRR